MKNLILFFSVLVLVGCSNQSTSKDSIIGLEFQNYKQVDQLSNYTKISDTSVYEKNIEAKYGLLHLRKDSTNLIVFKSISLDTRQNRVFKILDTLVPFKTNSSEVITIGYCQFNKDKDENLIALVDKSEGSKVEKIYAVWRANTNSKKIESVKNLDGISCLNEWF
jgi:hypothetical protein